MNFAASNSNTMLTHTTNCSIPAKLLIRVIVLAITVIVIWPNQGIAAGRETNLRNLFPAPKTMQVELQPSIHFEEGTWVKISISASSQKGHCLPQVVVNCTVHTDSRLIWRLAHKKSTRISSQYETA
jgi:hypothetical protein